MTNLSKSVTVPLPLTSGVVIGHYGVRFNRKLVAYRGLSCRVLEHRGSVILSGALAQYDVILSGALAQYDVILSGA